MSLFPSQNFVTMSPNSCSRRGFTLVEIMVSLVLFVILATGVLGSITTMHKIARTQATYNSVMALMMSEQEAIRGQSYAPPEAPFTASTTKTEQTKSVSLSPDGKQYMVDVTLVTVIEPVASGHKVTVTATFPQGGRTPSISTTTLINKYSSTNI